MLIVSRNLLRRKPDDFAWQADKRSQDTHVLVTPDMREDVWSRLVAAAGKIDVTLTPCRPVFDEWVKVSKAEADAWAKKGSSNEPIFDPTSWAARSDEGRAAEVRIYDNEIDMVLALIGTVRSVQNKELEVELAKRVLDSPKIRALVTMACSQVRLQLERRTEGHEETLSPLLIGEYKDIHHLTSWTKWATSYASCSVADNIAVLHDLYSGLDHTFSRAGPWQTPQRETDLPAFRKRLFKDKHTMRHNVGTVNEDSGWTARARWMDVPVWAGPSGTTHGLCWMLTQIGQVTPDQLLACCYGLFALWASPSYPKTATPIHHLFGVVTGASEYLPDAYKRFWDPETMYVGLAEFMAGPLLPSKLCACGRAGEFPRPTRRHLLSRPRDQRPAWAWRPPAQGARAAFRMAARR